MHASLATAAALPAVIALRLIHSSDPTGGAPSSPQIESAREPFSIVAMCVEGTRRNCCERVLLKLRSGPFSFPGEIEREKRGRDGPLPKRAAVFLGRVARERKERPEVAMATKETLRQRCPSPRSAQVAETGSAVDSQSYLSIQIRNTKKKKENHKKTRLFFFTGV